MDNLSKKARSENMSRIKSKNTMPEEIVRKYIFSKGLRFRKNDSRYPGKPDIVLPKYRTIVFVNGCFWHCHSGCKDFSIPKSNVDFWEKKLMGNVKRDNDNYRRLKSEGWNVLIIWECELSKGERAKRLDKLYYDIVLRDTLL